MSEIESFKVRLKKLAFQRSQPFCYSDYIECPSGRCPKCGSDDLMRSLDGVGVEYGTDWIVEHLLESNLSHVDLEQVFEESVAELYPQTVSVGWMNFDTVKVMVGEKDTSGLQRVQRNPTGPCLTACLEFSRTKLAMF